MPHWLQTLRTPNADAQAFNEVLQERRLHVRTKLDELAQKMGGRGVRSVLLVAHAGDGKSHYLQSLEGFGSFGASRERVQDWYHTGSHVLNDPSQLGMEQSAEFLVAAFQKNREGNNAEFAAGINRGLLREVIPHVKGDKTFGEEAAMEAATWLEAALGFQEGSHHPDPEGRLAIPLDRRVLVPAPASGAENPIRKALAWKVARNVFRALESELHGEKRETAWAVDEWADFSSVALAVVEATGHHVTFREALAHAAMVAEELRLATDDKHPAQALAVLFADGSTPPSLRQLVSKLRRIDPARIATPEHDGGHATARERDAFVRREAWQQLTAFYHGDIDRPDFPLPFRYGVSFLQICRELGALRSELISTKNRLRKLVEGPGKRMQIRANIRNVERGLLEISHARLDLKTEAQDGKRLFRGLTSVAWDSDRGALRSEVLPLTTPIQPGTGAGIDSWRVLRAAISIEKAGLVTGTRDMGDLIEGGLSLPSLVLDGPDGAPPSPSLRLDLELFELLARMGEHGQGTRAELGQRQAQVLAWLDGVVAGWKDALVEARTGFVVFQTLLGGRTREDPVPLRPPKPGPDRTLTTEERTKKESTVQLLQACWPHRAKRGHESVALTPAACASALLRWAGFVPDRLGHQPGHHSALREALGAGSVRSIRRRTRFLAPAFPWSGFMLGMALQGRAPSIVLPSESGSYWAQIGPRVGEACARVLGLHRNSLVWKRALRTTWANDEPAFDEHPSALLAHQWIGGGLEGRQLGQYTGATVLPDRQSSDIRMSVVASLLDPATIPFSPEERWWLLGTWACWWLMLDGLREIHCILGTPLVLPLVGEDGGLEYAKAHDRWFHPRHLDGQRAGALEAVAAIGQATGFLRPSNAVTNFDLLLHGPTLDVVQLVAREVYRDTQGNPTNRTVTMLQDKLLAAGLYSQRGELAVTDRMPIGSLTGEAPVSTEFDAALRRALQSLALLDEASDGATLIHAPWSEEGA